MEKVQSVNLDANETIFFGEELTKIKAKTYDKKYPEFTALQMIPVSTDAGAGAESISYQSFDEVGMIKIIANYADDLPRVDIKGTEVTNKVRSIGGSYGYNVQEIRNAQMAGKPLEQRRANACRRAFDQEINDIAWNGNSSEAKYYGLTGLLYNANITVSSADTGAWSSATADQIIEDVGKPIRDMISLTKGIERPNRVVLPLEQWGIISTRPRSTTSDTTILDFLQKSHPEITFMSTWELQDVSPKPSGAGTTDIMMIYNYDPDKLTLEIPQPFEQFPAQERNLEFVVPAHGRCGGVIVYYPLSITLVEGI